MKKITLALLLLMAATSLPAQQKQFSAKVYDGITFMPLPNASVYNMNTQKFAFTDSKGVFSIPLSLHDTLIVSKSVYRQLIVPVDEKVFAGFDDFFLYYKVTMLREVVIYGLNPSYEGFKKDIITLRLPDYYARLEELKLSKFQKDNAIYDPKGNLLTLGGRATMSPISFLYNKYSHKGKMQQLYNEMLSYEDEANRIQDKYNRELVQQLTGLSGDSLLEFMMFCRFSYYDLVRWPDEQIQNRIKSKYIDYQYYKMKNEEHE